MKKRTEIQKDLKRGFGSAPTGIKVWAKWLAGGFVLYMVGRLMCAFGGGVVTGLGGVVPTLVALVVVVSVVRLMWRIFSSLLSFALLILLFMLFCVIL